MKVKCEVGRTVKEGERPGSSDTVVGAAAEELRVVTCVFNYSVAAIEKYLFADSKVRWKFCKFYNKIASYLAEILKEPVRNNASVRCLRSCLRSSWFPRLSSLIEF